MREKLKKLANLLDMRDLLTFGGLGLLGYGLYLVHPASAMIVMGALIFWLGAR
jgi:hypothetical protein